MKKTYLNKVSVRKSALNFTLQIVKNIEKTKVSEMYPKSVSTDNKILSLNRADAFCKWVIFMDNEKYYRVTNSDIKENYGFYADNKHSEI